MPPPNNDEQLQHHTTARDASTGVDKVEPLAMQPLTPLALHDADGCHGKQHDEVGQLWQEQRTPSARLKSTLVRSRHDADEDRLLLLGFSNTGTTNVGSRTEANDVMTFHHNIILCKWLHYNLFPTNS